MTDDSYRIRPAGRHLLTIGRDLIQDHHAAIIELVKNAYDADSPNVRVSFVIPENRDSFQIIIEDSGHGMSRDTVIDRWLVPSTDDKLKRKTSPNGRIMQGRKGIGRYAAAILGSDLLLETVSSNQSTVVFIQWDLFDKAKYLDDVQILVETTNVKESDGTKLTITAPSALIELWKNSELDDLEYELKKLIPPVEFHSENHQSFRIFLTCNNFWEGEDAEYNVDKEIEPFPIFDLYDYKISGEISPDGKGLLTYTNQKAKNTLDESISYDFGFPSNCGSLVFDIRVYDREPIAIDALIQRGLKDEYGNYVGKLEARRILDKSNGIGVYRNGFRIRPLGNPDFDWLTLNEARVQNPSVRIGLNQVIGYVQIQSEELSGLEEKSARDGLKDNLSYQKLRNITEEIINEIEKRRFDYRKKAGLGRQTLKIEREFEKLFSFEDIKENVQKTLAKGGVDKVTSNKILNLLNKKEEESNKLSEDIKQTVAVYQGQATLGKIIKVVLHEGRKPLGFFTNQIKNFDYWAEELAVRHDLKALDEMKLIMSRMSVNSQIFISLFKRIDPLASGRRANRRDFDLHHEIEGCFSVFEHELTTSGIEFNIEVDTVPVPVYGWNQDIYIIVTNLIDNSIFWMTHKDVNEKCIDVHIAVENGRLLHMDYRDSGPGIEEELIKNGSIFDPEFTTKPNGTGLGLAIAGEAAARNGLELRAFSSDSGVYFRLQPDKGEIDE